MVIKTASPGIIVNEVDLTRGTSDAITTNIGALAGPFQKGPVGQMVLIETEAEFQRVFGDPNDKNYEYWYSVANYLEYGGVCYVIRTDDSVGDSSGTFLQTMKNATDEIITDEPIYVKNEEDFEENWYLSASAPGHFIAKNPGTWANGLAVAIIDHGADHQMALKSTGIVVEADGNVVADNTAFKSDTALGEDVGTYVKLTAAVGTSTLSAGDRVEEYNGASASGTSGYVMEVSSGVYTIFIAVGEFTVGTTLSADSGATETAVITAVDAIGTNTLYGIGGDFQVDTIFTPNTKTKAEAEAIGWTKYPTANFKQTTASGITYVYNASRAIWIASRSPVEDDLITDGTNVFQVQAGADWYTQQIAFAGIPWYRFASRPDTSQNALDKGALNDELNIILYDATGDFTGTKGNTLESYFGVSKLKGALTQEGDRNYYTDVINIRSSYIYSNQDLDGPAGGVNNTLNAPGTTIADGVFCQYVNVESLTLRNGVDNYNVSLGELQDAYNKLTTENVPDLDYIIQGPSMGTLTDAVAKANFIISIAEERKDCIAFLSPPRYMVVGQPDSETITDSIVEWAKELSSSSYAVFDSGYKYIYDRYNDQYRHVPLNGDIAGLLANASLVSEPWYSPAGLARGQIRNVVRLTYNPSKTQRDNLYTARVNPVVTFPGEGTILFGDKTALGYSSAFDRINVRKLFLVVEKEIAKISRTTLFEFNDDITRSLFKNNVNPFLRDVQAKRGMYDFLVVCDQTNNIPEVIDRNEFIADIYIKPAKSINFITLNFIATKTGVTFDESVGLFRGT
tara:strand:+ start:1969 stop:4356 length:2388 start_codon:yes stop_codon:yes gene_type:complete